MRRKVRDVEPVDGSVATEPATSDHDRFWGGDDLADLDHAQALAQVTEDETLEYGARSPLDPTVLAALAELMALATWAEDKACIPCRTRMEETHDPASLEHDECRQALRVARLLSRYPTESRDEYREARR
jgi:hypothetical protein